MSIGLPRGTRDYGPGESIVLRKIMDTAESTFRRFGFSPLETPSIELIETLSAKAYGQDSQKELYVLEGKEEGLRYDLTVPLARYMAMNRDTPLPFKRYQTGRVWRLDEPQHMRSREIIQSDIDVIGSAEPISDAEVIAAIALSIEQMGLRDYTILINSRILLNSILSIFKVPQDRHTDAIRALDKLEKIGRESVHEQISKLGLDSKQADALLNFVQQEGSNEEIMARLGNEVPGSGEEIKRIKSILSLIDRYQIDGKVAVDLSLARGLDYYTSTVFEFVVIEKGKMLPTVASGGRYDGLISLYSKNSLPAVGASIGITRVFEVMKAGELMRTYARVHVAYIKEENLEYAAHVANELRKSGISTDLGLTKRPLAKQLEYASSMRIGHVAIIGNQEREANKLKLRNMSSGEEELLSIEEAVSRLKE